MSTEDHSKLYNQGNVSSFYAKYRFEYPEQMFQVLVESCEQTGSCAWELAVDVGCGPGQSTLPLAKYFKQVIGVDSSEEQIKQAPKHLSNVSFRCASAYDLDFVTSGTVDLVTVATAFHWLDKDRFFKEADRVLKPGGSLVLYSFGSFTLNPPVVDEYLKTFDMPGRIIQFWPPSEMTFNKFRNVSLPYPGWRRGEVDPHHVQVRIEELEGSLRSFGCDKWFKDSPPGHDLPGEIARTLRFLCREELKSDQDFKLGVTLPVAYLMGHKPFMGE